MHFQEIFKTVKQEIPPTVCSTAPSVASSINCNNSEITLQILSGNVWLNPFNTATTDDLKYSAGDFIQMTAVNTLSLISDTTDATYQAIIWQ